MGSSRLNPAIQWALRDLFKALDLCLCVAGILATPCAGQEQSTLPMPAELKQQ